MHDDDADTDTLYSALSTVAAIGAGVLTRNLMTRVWTDTTGQEPPRDPSDPAVGWQEALTWAAAAGVAVGVGRVVGRRLAAGAYEKASGKQVTATG